MAAFKKIERDRQFRVLFGCSVLFYRCAVDTRYRLGSIDVCQTYSLPGSKGARRVLVIPSSGLDNTRRGRTERNLVPEFVLAHLSANDDSFFRALLTNLSGPIEATPN